MLTDHNFRAIHGALPTMLSGVLSYLWGLPPVQGAVVVLLSGLLSLVLAWLHSRKLRFDLDAARSAAELKALSEPPRPPPPPNGFVRFSTLLACVVAAACVLGFMLLALAVDGCSGQQPPAVIYHPDNEAARITLVGLRVGGCLACDHITPAGDVVGDGYDAGPLARDAGGE